MTRRAAEGLANRPGERAAVSSSSGRACWQGSEQGGQAPQAGLELG